MSGWRRKALEIFPERREELRHVRSIYDLLFQSGNDLKQAYWKDPVERGLIDRVYAFAEWGFGPRQNWSLRNAVAVGFYEHVPAFGIDARRDLAERLSAGVLAQLEPLFRQMNEEPVYAALMAEIERVHGPLPRQDAPAT